MAEQTKGLRAVEGCVSYLRLDQLLAGELTGVAESATRTHLASCARCAARHAELEKEQREFATNAPALVVPVGSSQSVVPLRPSLRSARRPALWSGAAGALALAAAALLVVFAGRGGPSGDDRTGIKGSESVGFFVKRGESVRRGVSGDRLRPRDELRFVYNANAERYLTIVAVDGANQATVYFPTEDVPTRVDPGRDVPLPIATELDDVLGSETVHAVFCEDPVSPATLRRAIAEHAPLPAGCVDSELHYEKAAP